jgi:long-chain acyl-CoA synthetase
MVGIWAKNRMEWATLDIAGIIFGISLVPLYETLGKL